MRNRMGWRAAGARALHGSQGRPRSPSPEIPGHLACSRMPAKHEPAITDTAARTARVGGDLLAFLGALTFAAGLTLLIDHTGQLSARLGFAGAAGLATGCVNAWRRLR